MCWTLLVYDVDWTHENQHLIRTWIDWIKKNINRWKNAYWISIFFEDGTSISHIDTKIEWLSNKVSEYKSSHSKKIVAILWHARYATSGKMKWKLHLSSWQPVMIDIDFDWEVRTLWFVFNGNKWNAWEVAEEYDFHNKYNIGIPILDTEVIKYVIIEYVQANPGCTLSEIHKHINTIMKWASNMIMLDKNWVVAWTDEEWVRFLPMSYSEEKGLMVVSSESSFLDALTKSIKDSQTVLTAWQQIVIDRKDLFDWNWEYSHSINEVWPIENYVENKVKTRLCAFEFLYLMGRESLKSYKIRELAGRKLAQKETEEIIDWECLVFHAPHTAFDVAKWFSDELWVDFETDSLYKMSKDRIFMSQIDDRMEQMKLIYQINYEAISELPKKYPNLKKIFLLDDTIVNGITGKYLVTLLKDALRNAYWREIEIHFRVWAFTVWSDCEDWAVMNQEQLVMQEYCENALFPTPEEIDNISREFLKSDSLWFLTFEDIEELILEHIIKYQYYKKLDNVSICRKCHDWTKSWIHKEKTPA